MERKDRLTSLMKGIGNKQQPKPQPRPNQAGEDTRPTVSQRKDLTAEEVERYEVSPEQEERLNALRRQKVGRPTGSGKKYSKERELRATFIITNPDTLRELKYIALADTKLYKDIINEALSSYVENWKERNGEIPIIK